jgi:7TM diverse intracellular signalling/7TMR-DISM extracellular 2
VNLFSGLFSTGSMNAVKAFLIWLACFLSAGNSHATEKPNPELATPLAELESRNFQVPVVSLGNWPVAINAAQVASASAETQKNFEPNTTHYASWDTPLWLRVRVQVDAPNAPESWVLNFDKPLLEQVEVYTRSADGFWVKQTAGLFTAHGKWPRQSLAPQFPMPAWTAGTHDVLIRVLHNFPIHFALTLKPAAVDAESKQYQFVLVGFLLGLMGLMCLASVAMAVIYRHTSYLWYALYVGVSFFACASYIGIANQSFWPNSPWWATNSSATLTMIAIIIQAQFCRTIFTGNRTLRTQKRWQINVMLLAGVVLTLINLYTDSAKLSALLLLVVIIAFTALMLIIIARARKKDSRIARLWSLAYLPLILTLISAVVENIGWLPAGWLPYYAPLYALVIEMPILMVALHLHAKTQYGITVRKNTLSSIDPTTGFITSTHFLDTLENLCDEAEVEGQDIAIAYIEATLHHDDMTVRRTPPPERTQQRIVRLLRTVSRNQDTVLHAGQNIYAILMPEMTLGESLSVRLSRLVVLGKMSDPGITDDIPIRFHIASTTLKRRCEKSSTTPMGGATRPFDLFESVPNIPHSARRFRNTASC